MTFKLTPPEAATPGPATHPGPFIRRELQESFGLTVSKAAELLMLQRVGLSRTLDGHHAVTADLAYRLEALTGLDAVMLLDMQAAYERDRDADKRGHYKEIIARLPPVETKAAQPR